MDITNWRLTRALLAALSSKYRMQIVELLAAGERCVCEMAYWPTRH
jgi:DNA-binding transcriptional ArsR family regulator